MCNMTEPTTVAKRRRHSFMTQYFDENYVMRAFQALPHRTQVVATDARGVRYINDSKGTNVGSTVAALSSGGPARNILALPRTTTT